MSEVHPNLGQDRLRSALGRPRGGLERPLQRYRECPVGRRMLCRVSVQGGGRMPHSYFRKNHSQVEFGNRKTVRWPFSDVPNM